MASTIAPTFVLTGLFMCTALPVGVRQSPLRRPANSLANAHARSTQLKRFAVKPHIHSQREQRDPFSIEDVKMDLLEHIAHKSFLGSGSGSAGHTSGNQKMLDMSKDIHMSSKSGGNSELFDPFATHKDALASLDRDGSTDPAKHLGHASLTQVASRKEGDAAALRYASLLQVASRIASDTLERDAILGLAEEFEDRYHMMQNSAASWFNSMDNFAVRAREKASVKRHQNTSASWFNGMDTFAREAREAESTKRRQPPRLQVDPEVLPASLAQRQEMAAVNFSSTEVIVGIVLLVIFLAFCMTVLSQKLVGDAPPSQTGPSPPSLSESSDTSSSIGGKPEMKSRVTRFQERLGVSTDKNVAAQHLLQRGDSNLRGAVSMPATRMKKTEKPAPSPRD